MVRLMLPPALLVSLSACLFYKESDSGPHGEEEGFVGQDDPCWRGERWVCDSGAQAPGDACWTGSAWVACEADDTDEDDGSFTPAELGVVLTPNAAPQDSAFIASLFTSGGFTAEEIAEIGFVSRDPAATLPTVVAQQVRSDDELLLTIDVPPFATVGVVDAYLTFTDDDYIVVERIFEVLEEGEPIAPWQPPSGTPPDEEPVEGDMDEAP